MFMTPLKKKLFHEKHKIQSFEVYDEYLNRIAKSLYYVHIPVPHCTSLPVTELAAEIFSEANKFCFNKLDIKKAAQYTRNGCVSPCLLVLSLLYLERLKTSNPKYLTKVPPTELFLISLLVGSKFLQDNGEEEELNNMDWANLTGFTTQKINKIEREFLDAIDWNVHVSEEEFWKRFNLLELKIGMKQGSIRGWFTYTELNVLLQIVDLTNLLQCLWNVISACLLSYTASVLALVGSTFLVSQIPGLGPKLKMSEVVNCTFSSSSITPETTLLCNTGNGQDCNISPSADWAKELEVTELKLFNKGEFKCQNNSNHFAIRNCSRYNVDLNCNFMYQFCENPSLPTLSTNDMSHSSFDFKNISSLTEDKFKPSTNWEWFYNENFNVQILSDYIKTLLKRATISGSYFIISNA